MLFIFVLLIFHLFIVVSIQHSYVLCEDKSTLTSIQQEDKSIQTDGCESAERKHTEELVHTRTCSMIILIS